jgi:hypothetical protein
MKPGGPDGVAAICRGRSRETGVEEELSGRSISDGEQTSRSNGSISRKIASVFLLDSISEGSTDTGDRGEEGGVRAPRDRRRESAEVGLRT